MRWALVLVGVLALPGMAAAQSGGSFWEVVLGPVIPLGDDTWDNYIDPSLAFGVRGGATSQGKVRVGGEIGLDYHLLGTDDPAFTTLDLHRVRAIVAGRVGAEVAPQVFAYGRMGVGLDWVFGEVTLFGAQCDGATFGLALEPGVGVAYESKKKLRIGGQIDVPIAFHDDEDNCLVETHFDAVDLSILVTIGSRL